MPIVNIASQPDPFWKIVHRVADARVSEIEGRIVLATNFAIAGIDKGKLRRGIAAGNFDTVTRSIPFGEWHAALVETMTKSLGEVFWNTAEKMASHFDLFVEDVDVIKGERLPVDLSSQAAADWASKFAADQAADLTSRSVDAVRRVLADGLMRGDSITTMADQIRKSIGLTSGQAAALDRFYQARVKEGVPRGRARALRTKRSKDMLARRANDIARTETIRAASAGQIELIREAVRQGRINEPDKKWKVTPDDRLDESICAPMADQVVPMNEPFVTGLGDLVHYPPAHNKCRCSQSFTTRRGRR